MDHDGLCPSSLTDLSPDYWPAAPEAFCAYARRDGRIGRYVYFSPSGRLADLPESTALAADYPGNHSEGGSVLYTDGSVVWMNDSFPKFVASLMPSGVTLATNSLKWYEWQPGDL